MPQVIHNKGGNAEALSGLLGGRATYPGGVGAALILLHDEPRLVQQVGEQHGSAASRAHAQDLTKAHVRTALRPAIPHLEWK